MKFSLYVYAIFVASISSNAYAEQWYSMKIINKSYDNINISPVPGKCMHTWNVPYPSEDVKYGSESNFDISDKNTIFACDDKEKSTYWKIVATNGSVTHEFQIGFSHKGFSSPPGWYTRIEESSPGSVRSATCAAPDPAGAIRQQDCLNFYVPNVPEYGLIRIEI
ncbi:hypothetical protein [Brucella intermedia]|uniref:hypothetical protein n=1 Tax=Brucella intermedia TaxID=94625 RepID=UPI0011155B5D|nr:hypothetical protein [Brucella intermedia]KAB2694410.1 hypothetical protein F9K72_13975 [Brucella intermedia]